MEQTYAAPWAKSLKLGTGWTSALLLGIAAAGALAGSRHSGLWWIAMVALPTLLLLVSLPFMVRGYRLTDHELRVRRLGFDTVIPLADLKSVRGIPDLFRSSLRVFGNAGLFSITGWFWRRGIGRFRAYATDPDRAVLLEFSDRRIVVTPHDPQAFIVGIRRRTRAM